MVRFEFLECLIRLGIYKFYNCGNFSNQKDAILEFLRRIVENIPKKCTEKGNQFR